MSIFFFLPLFEFICLYFDFQITLYTFICTIHMYIIHFLLSRSLCLSMSFSLNVSLSNTLICSFIGLLNGHFFFSWNNGLERDLFQTGFYNQMLLLLVNLTSDLKKGFLFLFQRS